MTMRVKGRVHPTGYRIDGYPVACPKCGGALKDVVSFHDDGVVSRCALCDKLFAIEYDYFEEGSSFAVLLGEWKGVSW